MHVISMTKSSRWGEAYQRVRLTTLAVSESFGNQSGWLAGEEEITYESGSHMFDWPEVRAFAQAEFKMVRECWIKHGTYQLSQHPIL